jgi:hypothetical protein
LDGTLRALGFTSTTNKTLVNLDGCRFAVFHLVNAYWASVYAGFASVAFIVNYDFYHFSYLYWFLSEAKKRDKSV